VVFSNTHRAKQLKDQISKNSAKQNGDNALEIQEWEDALKRLQKMAPVEATADRMRLEEIPSLQVLLSEKENNVPSLSTATEKV
jgi:hypothetical protein